MMKEYIIRTDKESKLTHIVTAERVVQPVGMVYTDFELYMGIRDITNEDVVRPDTKRTIGRVRIKKGNDLVSASSRWRELAAIDEKGGYREGGKSIRYLKMPKAQLIQNEEFRGLGNIGIMHAYFMGRESTLAKVFCFERDGEYSGVVYAKDEDVKSALKGLVLFLAQRIENQGYIFEFMKK